MMRSLEAWSARSSLLGCLHVGLFLHPKHPVPFYWGQRGCLLRWLCLEAAWKQKMWGNYKKGGWRGTRAARTQSPTAGRSHGAPAAGVQGWNKPFPSPCCVFSGFTGLGRTGNYSTAPKTKPKQYSAAWLDGLSSEMCNKESVFSLHGDQYSYPGR